MIDSAWQAFLRMLGEPFRLWRSSLLTRTVAITVTLSGLAVTAIGGYMSLTIADSLFSGRVNQILSETARATSTAQALFDNSVTAAGAIDVETANTAAQTAIRSAQSSPRCARATRLRRFISIPLRGSRFFATRPLTCSRKPFRR